MLKVSGVRVSEWDGAVTGSREQAELELDLLTTLNGDVFAGSLQRIEENVLHFQNDFASFQVPMDRVGDLAFATPTRAKPRLREGDIQLLLHSGERVTLQISQIQEGRVVAQAEISGEVNLNLDYVKALLINPHDNRHQLKKEDW
jgi:hypothetical protein